jgi:pantetheine-phosphate adenylyltransferase
MSSCFYPGSFDPFTKGHLEIVKKASSLFDTVYIGIGYNPDKKRHFDVQKMKAAIKEICDIWDLNNVEVIIFNNLTADVAKSLGVQYIVRGIRDNIDYNYEESLAKINYELTNGIDTLYLRASKFGFVSSSFIRELIKYDKDCIDYVPGPVYSLIKEEKHE